EAEWFSGGRFFRYKTMPNYGLPVWVSHGDGYFYFATRDGFQRENVAHRCLDKKLVSCIQNGYMFPDDYGIASRLPVFHKFIVGECEIFRWNPAVCKGCFNQCPGFVGTEVADKDRCIGRYGRSLQI